MSQSHPAKPLDPPAGVTPGVLQEILRAIEGIQFGSVEIVIHDARVVQIESREKIRLTQDRPARP